MGNISVPAGEFKRHHINCEQLRNIFLEPNFNDDEVIYEPKEVTDFKLELAYSYILRICDFVVEYDVEQEESNIDDGITEIVNEFNKRNVKMNYNLIDSLHELLQDYYQKYDFIIEYDGNRQTILKDMPVSIDACSQLLEYYASDSDLNESPLGCIIINSITGIKKQQIK